MDPKEINKTGFCNKQIDNIISNDLKDYILKDIKLRTGIDHRSRYAKIYNNAYKKNLKSILKKALVLSRPIGVKRPWIILS